MKEDQAIEVDTTTPISELNAAWLEATQKVACITRPPPGWITRRQYRKIVNCGETTAKVRLGLMVKGGIAEQAMHLAERAPDHVLTPIPHYLIKKP